MTHDPGDLEANCAIWEIMTKRLDGEGGPSIAVFPDTGNSGAVEVGAALAAEITAGFGPRQELPLAIVASVGDAVVGGLNGASHWGWCYIRQLWVAADWRRSGLGRQLLAEAEVQARVRGCVGLYVDTFDPGAALFYERAGFARFGAIDDFPPGHARTFLLKRLALEAGAASPDR